MVSQGAIIENDSIKGFESFEGSYFSNDETYLCDLSTLGIIKVSGEEAQSFLHGQFTNDLNQVDNKTSQLSSYCNAKGRLLSIFRVFKHSDNYLLLLRKDVLDNTLKKLNMFKLMAKAEITNSSDEYVVMGLAGKNTESILKNNNISFPENDNQCFNNDEYVIIRIDKQRALIIAKPEKAIELWKAFENSTVASDYYIWQLFDIRNGIPEITEQTYESFIPQMVNLELIGGVNFQKGCYPGQEIVARTHYLGKPNRRMYKVEILTEENFLPGTNIYSKEEGEQAVGKIVSSVRYSRDNVDALIVLRTEKESSNYLNIGSLAGPSALMRKLPYNLEST